MGSAEGARKARQYQIEQFGSVERAAKILGARGGKNSTSRPFKDTQKASEAGKASTSRPFKDVELAREAGKKSGIVRRAKAWAKQEATRLTIHEEN